MVKNSLGLVLIGRLPGKITSPFDDEARGAGMYVPCAEPPSVDQVFASHLFKWKPCLVTYYLARVRSLVWSDISLPGIFVLKRRKKLASSSAGQRLSNGRTHPALRCPALSSAMTGMNYLRKINFRIYTYHVTQECIFNSPRVSKLVVWLALSYFVILKVRPMLRNANI